MKVVHYPDSLLRSVCERVEEFSDVQNVVDQMIALMRAENGVGLAAPQIGILKRIVVIDPSGGADPQSIKPMLNPIIEFSSPLRETAEEGCLSLPGYRATVVRPAMISVKYQRTDGTSVSEFMQGFEARVAQHEFDHLDGITLMQRGKEIHR